MTAELILHGLQTSNNMKVRVALGYKEIPYEYRVIDRADRSELVRLSGQYLTPVIVHGDRVLFDSAAILRYLDANFRDRPALFGSSKAEQWEIEDLEFFARTILAGPMMEVAHRRSSGRKVEDAVATRCGDEFRKAASGLIRKLGSREWLVGDRMSAADVTAGAVIHRVRTSGLFEMPDGIEAIDPWVARVMSYDRYRDQPSG